MRIIIYTGKGGVGKTSMVAATASKIAKDGKKVLVMSTDQAHSLGDSFDKKVGKEPVEITENLYAVEIDTVYESERSWGNLKDYMKLLLTARGGGGIEAEELLVFPGLEELFSMFKILDVYESGVYDTIIVDCAPTGETLSLLKYPGRLSGFVKKILPIERTATKTVGKVIEKTMKVPMPKDSVFDDIESLMELQQRELRTLEMLESVGEEIFKECNPNDVLFQQKIYEVNAEEKSLRIYLPFADKKELRLEQEKNELLVGVRNEIRRFPVPPEFAGMEVAGAKFEAGYLNIRFDL